MSRVVALIIMAMALPGPSLAQAAASAQAVQAVTPDALVRARQAYNAERFDEAIILANTAREVDRQADSASLVLARASLERFRQFRDVADVATARQALLSVDPTRLSPSEARELRLGTAELLFVDEQFGAAAEIFEAALADEGSLPSVEHRERLFDWWASALDRHAQYGQEGDRHRSYMRILLGAEREVGRSPSSTAVLYWLAAANRGIEDFERAWALVVSGWIQAPQVAPGARAAALQEDLDVLMRDAIIPERARRAAPQADPEALKVALAAEWDAIKKRWGR
jgi:hypothetical protein